MAPADGDDRAAREPGRVGGHAQDRDALVLRGVRVGAHRQPDVVGLLGAAREDLGPVDDVLVAVAHGPGAQRRQVGAGLGLGVADGEVDLARPGSRAGRSVFCSSRAVAHDRRPDRVDRDEGERAHLARRVSSKKMNWSVAGRPWPPYSGGPADPEPPVLADAPHDLAPACSPPSPTSPMPGPHLVGEQRPRSRRAARGAAPAARGSPRRTWSPPVPRSGPATRSRPLLLRAAGAVRLVLCVAGTRSSFRHGTRPPGSSDKSPAVVAPAAAEARAAPAAVAGAHRPTYHDWNTF